jgi:multidrug efflux pump subunit AcrA (membrane-fusion protein)
MNKWLLRSLLLVAVLAVAGAALWWRAGPVTVQVAQLLVDENVDVTKGQKLATFDNEELAQSVREWEAAGTRVRTQLIHQVTVAAMKTADRNVSARLS